MTRDEQFDAMRADIDTAHRLMEAAEREIDELKAKLSEHAAREDALFKRLMDSTKRAENAEYELKLLKATLNHEYEATEQR